MTMSTTTGLLSTAFCHLCGGQGPSGPPPANNPDPDHQDSNQQRTTLRPVSAWRPNLRSLGQPSNSNAAWNPFEGDPTPFGERLAAIDSHYSTGIRPHTRTTSHAALSGEFHVAQMFHERETS
ncbi:hypothetical protein BT96DRAFT_951411 [Gymnopus androsaceus JB14]|uniref:Uncharacterized protein n=1 Tax=Gymnopus androsaceus JB14 TaxID=1447944 RepID=A0A6A4GD57_9AGAR|nr:hypothetical protein BT96DRAFT_951411 [Gymnopus androsaceus JB14]